MCQDELDLSLDKMLSEDPASATERAATAFDRIAAPFGKSLVLFGAGGIGKKTAGGLRKVGIEPRAFADNNQTLWGTKVAGIPVFSPAEAAAKFCNDATFVCTIWRGEGREHMGDRMRQLADLGCRRVVPFGQLFWKYAEIFTPHYAFDLPDKVLRQRADVRKAFSLFRNRASREEFLAQLRWRLYLDFDRLPDPVAHAIYFPDDLVRWTPHETFVDAGAFDGDTIRTLLARPGQESAEVIAFEPDPANFQKLQKYAAKLPDCVRSNIEVRKQALGARREKLFFAASGTPSSMMASSGIEVQVVPLDEVLGDRRCTTLKMDIEGAELDALEGARRCIRRDLPLLAVCCYHRQDHLWKVPLLIDSISDNYRFFLRPHLLEVWDLVCYAIPKDRLLCNASESGTGDDRRETPTT